LAYCHLIAFFNQRLTPKYLHTKLDYSIVPGKRKEISAKAAGKKAAAFAAAAALFRREELSLQPVFPPAEKAHGIFCKCTLLF
jgi:hypothetical protein